MPETSELRAKTRVFAVLTVLTNVAGNSALTKGMHQVGDPGNTPAALIGALFHPWVALGVALLIVWTLTHMALLSWADLSYVLPVTAIGYVIAVFLGKTFLHETVTRQRWMGTLLIFAGALLVGSTSRNTTE